VLSTADLDVDIGPDDMAQPTPLTTPVKHVKSSKQAVSPKSPTTDTYVAQFAEVVETYDR
jgi:hypothetical protein